MTDEYIIDMDELDHGVTVEVHQDMEGWESDPRDWTNAGVMVTWAREYSLGDDQITWPREYGLDDLRDLAELRSSLRAKYPGARNFHALYLHDHGSNGATMSMVPLVDALDYGSSFVGVTFATEKTLSDTGVNVEDIDEALAQDVAVYSSYLEGDVTGYVVKRHGQVLDSCWGFVGGYGDYAREEGRAVGAWHVKRFETWAPILRFAY